MFRPRASSPFSVEDESAIEAELSKLTDEDRELAKAQKYCVLLPDSRARDAWLGECRHRTAYYYDNGGYYRHNRRHGHDDRGRQGGYAPGYDYCEAYFDDYYRTYRPSYAYSYAAPTSQSAATYQTGERQVSEVVTERYEPIRSRIIQRDLAFFHKHHRGDGGGFGLA